MTRTLVTVPRLMGIANVGVAVMLYVCRASDTSEVFAQGVLACFAIRNAFDLLLPEVRR